MDTLPQIQTIIQEFGPPISTIIDAPWVSVTSVNGMTGDVVIELILSDFQANHYYAKNTAVLYQGLLYYAKSDFTTGTIFNINDWNYPEFTQVQADWDTTDISASSYIKNKPTKLSEFENDENLTTNSEVSSAINTAIEPINTELGTLSTNINDVSTGVSTLSNNVSSLFSSLESKVDKETGKGLSTNDFTDTYKTILDGIKATIFEQTYPIGSIYTSTTLSTASAVSESLGGGTWEAYASGRVLVGIDSNDRSFDTIGKTGGEKDHTLSEYELPHITGNMELHSAASGTNIANGSGVFSSSTVNPGKYRDGGNGGTGSQSLSNIGFALGYGWSHNNLQPYIVVYMWRRIA